jgi:hypothetical protein
MLVEAGGWMPSVWDKRGVEAISSRDEKQWAPNLKKDAYKSE